MGLSQRPARVDGRLPYTTGQATIAQSAIVACEILNLVKFRIFKSDETGTTSTGYVWKFESNLLNINVDDKPVAFGLAWPWP